MAGTRERAIKHYWRVIQSRKWILTGIFLFTVMGTLIGSLLWTPVYEATATILLDYANPTTLNMQGRLGGGFSMEYMLTQKSIVESNNVAMRVIEQLKLAQNPALKEAYQDSRPSGFIQKYLFGQKDKGFKMWLLDFLRKSLKIVPQQDSRIIAITFGSADHNFSAAAANSFAWAYNNYHLELKVSPLKESVDWISKKVDELRLDAEDNRRTYDAVLAKFSEATLRGEINRTNVIVIDKATPPAIPVTPQIFLNLFLSVVVGFLLGIGVIFFLDFLDNTIRGEEDIEADFGLVVLGVIPRSE